MPTTRDEVIEAEEALLDAIEVYAVGRADSQQQGSGHVRDEEAFFPSQLRDKARRLRAVIYAHEGLGEDYLAGIAKADKQDASNLSTGRDEYVITQEELLGMIEDYSTFLWQGAYAEITQKASRLRRAVMVHEGLGANYLDSSKLDEAEVFEPQSPA